MFGSNIIMNFRFIIMGMLVIWYIELKLRLNFLILSIFVFFKDFFNLVMFIKFEFENLELLKDYKVGL